MRMFWKCIISASNHCEVDRQQSLTQDLLNAIIYSAGRGRPWITGTGVCSNSTESTTKTSSKSWQLIATNRRTESCESSASGSSLIGWIPPDDDGWADGFISRGLADCCLASTATAQCTIQHVRRYATFKHNSNEMQRSKKHFNIF